MSIKRVITLVIFVIAVLIGLFHPLLQSSSTGTGSSTYEPATITNFEADYTVDNNGFLTATEVITTKLPSGRHGIFQFWDVADPANPKGRYYPTIVSVELDGKPEKYETYWQKGGTIYVAKIGKADVTLLPGLHTYTIRYTTPGVISPFSAGANKTFPTTTGENQGDPQSAFYWNVIAPGWQMPIAKATIKVNLPNATEQVQCAAGTTSGSASAAAGYGPCSVTGAGTPNLTLTATNIPPVSGMTVRATMAPTNKALRIMLPPESGSSRRETRAVTGRSCVTFSAPGALADRPAGDAGHQRDQRAQADNRDDPCKDSREIHAVLLFRPAHVGHRLMGFGRFRRLGRIAPTIRCGAGFSPAFCLLGSHCGRGCPPKMR